MGEKIVFVGLIFNPTSLDTLKQVNGYLSVENGKITRFGDKKEYEKFAKDGKFSAFETVVLGPNQFLLPGFIDTHTHAPQFPNIGLGLDRPLLQWLEKYTFPMEKKYEDVDFAARVYDKVVKRLLNNGTTTVCYFGSLSLAGTKELVKSVVKHQQRAIVGKVSMNIKNEAGYYQDTQTELQEVETFVKDVLALQNDLVQPAVTPRFAVSCDRELMTGLAKIAKKYDCFTQSHISENDKEIEHVLNTNPDCKSYSEVYDKCNILNNKCLMAHAVHLSREEVLLLKARGTSLAHCPASNTRLRSGLCPVKKYTDTGIDVGLGTDVSGGDSALLLDAMRSAMDVSIHLGMKDESIIINYKEAIYLATLGGAKALRLDDKTGNFEVGKDFDALVIDVYANGGRVDDFETIPDKTSNEHASCLLEKFVYVGDDRNILQVYVKGEKVKDIFS